MPIIYLSPSTQEKNLYVNGGSYSSAQGDGILVRNGSATITAGNFSGKDNYSADGGGFVAGPGASYAFKVLGGTANVSGGRFASAGNGAFVMEGSATASCEEASDFTVGGARCAVRMYERYSAFGGNRVAMSLTLMGSGGRLHLTAMTAGGSQAMFFKLNTLGEESFLGTLEEIVDRLERGAGR